MAAAESGVSLVYHDITASGNNEGASSFLPRLMRFLEQVIDKDISVGTLYSAMLKTGEKWREGSRESVELFSELMRML